MVLGRRLRRVFNPARRRLWLPAAAPVAIGAVMLLFFWKLAFSGLILARGDTFLYFYPYWEFAARALRQGDVPLWNPHIFMGAPFLANSQAGYFYPLNWPLWLALPTPYAVSASILLHIFLAGLGSYLLARRLLGLSVAASLLSGMAFALGGYLTAQVEHVNQLQGLAWMPWLTLALGWAGERGRRAAFKRALWASSIVAMQLLAGHTQSLFISVVAALFFRVANDVSRYRGRRADESFPWRAALRPLAGIVGLFLLAGFGGGLLAAIQLLPTLELAQLSGRGGGLPLNEAVSFSLHPLLLTRALLPTVGETLFSEYVAVLPLTLLLLASIAAWQWRRAPLVKAPLALALGGLILALGRFNPLYLLLAQLPGFSFFRAPARWLALYALGVALLAGIGLDIARGVKYGRVGRVSDAPLRWGALLAGGLAALGFAAPWLARFAPVGAEATIARPALLHVGLWAVELLAAGMLLSGLERARGRERQLRVALIGVVALAMMFVASRAHPYNRLTSTQAYAGLRPPAARLQALEQCLDGDAPCTIAPQRLLSLSDIFFDPGDLAELSSLYGTYLGEEGFYDLIVATKQKEILAPNLPMVYGLASVDGFDGGLLPLRSYGALMRLILPGGAETTDGRLREYLDAIPDAQWLDLFGARYLITDKVGDEWREGVFFDTQHALEVVEAEVVQVGYLPAYEATELWALGELEGVTAGIVTVEGDAWTLEAEEMVGGLWRLSLPEPSVVQSVQMSKEGGSWSLRGLALVDGRDSSFHSIVPGAYRLIYSGDVKIYENLDVLPRAFMVYLWQWRPDVESSVAAMAAPGFQPGREAAVVGSGSDVRDGAGVAGEAEVVRYGREEIVVATASERPGLLVVTDAYYPGWEVEVDGSAAELQQVNGLFRGVFVTAGAHEVRFTLRSRPYQIGLYLTLFAAATWATVQLVLSRRRRP